MENKIRAKLYYFYKNYLGARLRFSSFPYITGDTIRNYANHIFDDIKKFNPLKVKEGDKIFVKADMLEEFFKNVDPEIQNNYYLFSHNSDAVIDENYKNLLSEKVLYWFAQNLDFKISDNVLPIPIGLENRWYQRNGKLKPINKVVMKPIKKDILILSAFNHKTNIIRKDVKDYAEKKEFITQLDSTEKIEYLTHLSRSKFNLCPEGNGLDTHRIWESLIFNCIPIVINNSFSKNFIQLGIPLLVLDDWSELLLLKKNDLNIFYDKYSDINMSKFSKFDYWENFINQYLDV